MKIGIVGAGAMGCVYAALMADAGNEVWAIDTWQAHVDAIAANGLRLEGASGDRTVALGCNQRCRHDRRPLRSCHHRDQGTARWRSLPLPPAPC